MSSEETELTELRREIDRVDDAVLALLAERLELVGRIADLKRQNGGTAKLAQRPAREAQLLRRLVAKAGHRFPKPTLVRMWRELLAATTRLQTPFTVGVLSGAAGDRIWDVARDHFGSLTPLYRMVSPGHALRSVDAGTVDLVLLPMPRDQDRWWRPLHTTRADAPRAVAHLPFCDVGQYGADSACLVFGVLPREASGEDRTLLAFETDPELSRTRLVETLRAAGLSPRWLAGGRETGEPGAAHLVEVAGYVAAGDQALQGALEPVRGEILRCGPIGSYARPLSEAELA